MVDGTLKKQRWTAWVVAALLAAMAIINYCVAEETDDYIHYRLGVKFKNENNFDQAVEEFRKVLTAYPDNYNAYMQLAEIRKSQNSSRLEIFNLKKALAYNPGWGKAHMMLAEAYESDKQFQNAIMELQMYEQSCDPAEQDGVQKQIDKLMKKAQGQSRAEAHDSSVSGSIALPSDSARVKKADSGAAPRQKASVAPAMIAHKDLRRPAPEPQGSAEAMLKKAVALYEEGKTEAALPYVKKALLMRPHYAEAYFYGGLLRYKLGQIDLAKINFAKSFAFPAASIDAHFYLGKIFGTEKYYKGAVEELTAYVAKAADGSQRKEALTLLAGYKKIINDTSAVPLPAPQASATAGPDAPAAPPERETDVPESGYAIVEMRIDSLLTMQVVDTLTDPGRAMLKGVNEFKAGRFDDAVKEFKKVMASYPAAGVAAPCTYNIGVCYMKLRLFPNADNQFDNLCNRYGNHPLAAQSLFLKAFSYSERGDLTRSEKMFREFIQRYRNHAWTGKAYEKLGDVYSDLKQSNKAMDAYYQAAGRTKDFADQIVAYFKLGAICFEAGNPERAITSFKKAIETGESRKIFSRVPDSYYKIADYKYQQKDYKTANEYYQKAVRKYPTYQETPWGLFQLGNIYKNNRNYSKAIAMYKELIAGHADDYWAKQARWKLDDAVWENEYKTILQ